MNYYKVALSKYAVFSGRSRRSEYWYFVLCNVIISFALSLVDGMLGFGGEESAGIFGGLYALAMIIPSIAVGVRRLHDIGKSGWWMFILLVPILGVLVLFFLMIRDSQPGDNQYGPNPKGVGGSSSNSSANNATSSVSSSSTSSDPAGFPTSTQTSTQTSTTTTSTTTPTSTV